MSNDLTDLSGIGKKTAEKLREDGIDSVEELAEARRQGDPRLKDFNKRVERAALDAAQDRYGSFADRTTGVQVTDENRDTVDLTSRRDVSSLSDSGKVTRNKSEFQDDTLLDLGRKAVQGAGLKERLGGVRSQQDISDTVVTTRPEGQNQVEDQSRIDRMQAKRNIYTFGVDVAAELANTDRETIEEANDIRERTSTRRGKKTGFTKTEEREKIRGEGTTEYEKDVRVRPREYAAAKRVHQARKPKAKRVDNRRKAEVTGDFDEWVEDPARHDYPGVDTPERGGAAGSAFGFTPDETQLEARVDFTPADQDNEFEVRETSADGGGGFGSVEGGAGAILSAPQETQRIILNDLLPSEEQREKIGLQLRGPDQELFEGNPEGDFLVSGDR